MLPFDVLVRCCEDMRLRLREIEICRDCSLSIARTSSARLGLSERQQPSLPQRSRPYLTPRPPSSSPKTHQSSLLCTKRPLTGLCKNSAACVG
ncbi:unnamed protein product [Chrysoparadoxa australica]